MARSNNRGGNRGGNNNNPSGRNQYSGGVMDLARERPFAAAAAAAGAAAAGLFLWSRRAQISNQLSNLSDQIGEWTENMGSGSSFGSGDDTGGLTTSNSTGSRPTSTRSRGMSETGGGNASLGAVSGGGGSSGASSGRGRARSTAATQQ